jgi:hypothetical protein
MHPQQQKPNKNNDLLRYAGLGTQIFVALGLSVFAGIRLDGWLNTSMPIFAWVLPLIVICVMIYQLVKQTSKKK